MIDTSVVVAYMNRSDDDHSVVRDWLEQATEELVTTPLAVAEMDHLVGRLGGPAAAAALRRDLEAGAYAVEWCETALKETLTIADRHDWLPLGLTDASLVALAGRLGSNRIATLDERHFRRLEPQTRASAFTLLPADAR